MNTAESEQKLLNYKPLILILGMTGEGKLGSVLVDCENDYREVMKFYKVVRRFLLTETSSENIEKLFIQ